MIKPQNAFASKVERFVTQTAKPKDHEVPGPGSYAIELYWDSKKSP